MAKTVSCSNTTVSAARRHPASRRRRLKTLAFVFVKNASAQKEVVLKRTVSVRFVVLIFLVFFCSSEEEEALKKVVLMVPLLEEIIVVIGVSLLVLVRGSCVSQK